MALDRQPKARHRGQDRAMPRDHDADLARPDRALRGPHPGHPAGVHVDARDLAVLDDVHAPRIRRPRVAPGDRIVARVAAASLQRAAQDRVARLRRGVEDRAERLDLRGRQQLGVHRVQPVGVDAPGRLLQVVDVVDQVQHAPLAEHQVVVELLREALPELQRMLVEGGAFVPQVVGADHGGVAPGVAAAEPALLQHRDVGNTVEGGEVVGGGEPVPAGADDDDVVGRLRRGAPPLLRPALVMAQRVAREAEDRELLHLWTPEYRNRPAVSLTGGTAGKYPIPPWHPRGS